MKLITISSRNFSEAIAEAVEALRAGAVIAHSTDTVWGLACDAGNAQAVRKIHRLKNSDPTKPLLLNLPSKSYLNQIGSKLCKAHKLVREFWPGSLSMLIRSKDGQSKLGVRLPDHEVSRALARKFGSPLTTTSANITGDATARDAAEVAKIFPKVDLILDDGAISKDNPSTLVDVSGSEIQLIRDGSIPFRDLES